MIVGGGAISAALISGSALLLMRQSAHDEALRMRIGVARGVAPVRKTGEGENLGRLPFLQIVTGLGVAIVRSGLLSKKTLSELEQTLETSGFRAESALGLFIGSKILLLLALPFFGMILLPAQSASFTRTLVIAFGAIIGLLLPDWTVGHIREAYRKKLQAGLPDALDMMVICAQAGLGLEPSLARVSYEIRSAHREVAQELALTANEMQVMTDTRAALLRLGDRTGVASLKRLTATLAQTIQYGTPLADALRSLSAEMRQEILTAFEERAARLPVFLTIPMILCILPCVMIIVGGPAFIRLFAVLSH